MQSPPDSAQMAQTRWEIETFVMLLQALKPARILEIGTWYGGTLWYWLQIASQEVVSVDDEMRNLGEWEQWTTRDGFCAATFLQGSNTDPDIIRQAAALGPYDMVFIDADHVYDAVSADWANYGWMASENGIVAFHDIVERPDYGVSRLWDELRAVRGAKAVEIVQTWEQEEPCWGGIGVIFQ